MKKNVYLDNIHEINELEYPFFTREFGVPLYFAFLICHKKKYIKYHYIYMQDQVAVFFSLRKKKIATMDIAFTVFFLLIVH